MDSAGDAWLETVLDIVVNSEVWFNETSEVLDNLRIFFVQESLQFGDILKLTEVLLKFSVELEKYLVVLV